MARGKSTGMTRALSELRKAEQELVQTLAGIRGAIRLFSTGGAASLRAAAALPKMRGKRQLSAAGRAAIARAARLRWAKWRASKKKTSKR